MLLRRCGKASFPCLLYIGLLAQVLIAQCSAISCPSRSNSCGPKTQLLHTASTSLYLSPASCRHCGQIIWQVLPKFCFAQSTCFIGHLAQVASSIFHGQTARPLPSFLKVAQHPCLLQSALQLQLDVSTSLRTARHTSFASPTGRARSCDCLRRSGYILHPRPIAWRCHTDPPIR